MIHAKNDVLGGLQVQNCLIRNKASPSIKYFKCPNIHIFKKPPTLPILILTHTHPGVEERTHSSFMLALGSTKDLPQSSKIDNITKICIT